MISYAALRTIHIHKDQILLNGEAQYLRLVLDQGYYPEGLWTAPSVEALRRDIELAREIGFNGARLHQKVFEPLYFSLADELGFMVFCEFPDWNGGCSNRWEVSDEYQDLLTSEWKRTVKDLHNHPSICCWGPFNEFGPKNGRLETKTSAFTEGDFLFNFFPECVAKGPRLTLGVWGQSLVRDLLSQRSQPLSSDAAAIGGSVWRGFCMEA